MLKKLFLILALLICIPVSFSQAQEFDLFDEETLDEDKTLMIGEVYIIPSTNPGRVSVRNPEVLDVSKVTDKEVIVVAKKSGDTAVTIWSKDGQKTIFVTVFGDDLDRIKRRLSKLIHKDLGLTNIELKKNEGTGKIILMGEVMVNKKEQLDKVLTPFADKVDNLVSIKKESKMVQIEARILEMNKTDLDRLGIDWMDYIQIRQEPYGPPSQGSGSTSSSSSASGTNIVETTLNLVKPMHGVWSMALWSRDAFHARINLLIQDGNAKELSRPKLLCLSGEESKLLVGGEVPYLSGTTSGSAGTSVSIDYKEYGVIFKLRPTVLNDGKIYLNLGTEVSALDWANGIDLLGIRIPAFIKREANTILNLSSGETIFIAGLIQNTEADSVDKFPALGNVPVLGALFRSKEFRARQTELVITLTPEIIESQKSAEFPAVKDMREKPYRNVMSIQESNIPQELQAYVLRVQRKIIDNMSYPVSLVNTGWEGSAVLKLTLDRKGDLRDVRVSKSSGYKIFDDDAVRLVRSLSFPAFPSGVEIQELNIDIPIAYRENR